MVIGSLEPILLRYSSLPTVNNDDIIGFFFYLCFLPQPFTNHRTTGEGGGHWPGDYCRELTCTHR